MKYLFTSERLGFRLWTAADRDFFVTLNSDKKVMEFFPAPLTKDESYSFLDRIDQTYIDHRLHGML